MLFGPRATTRLNGPSVHDGALLTQRYVRAVEGEKAATGRRGADWDGETEEER